MSDFIQNFNYDEYLNSIEHFFDDKKYFEKKSNDIKKIKDVFVRLNRNLNDTNSESNQIKSFYSLSDGKEHGYLRPLNQNLNKNYDLIFSGCSQTNFDYLCPPNYPDGDHKYIWGFQVANYFNKEALNLAICGDGIYQIVRKIFYQIFKNGNPKVILILFPDYGRLTMPHTENLKSKINKDSPEFIKNYYLFGHSIDRSSVFKSPYYVEDIFDATIPLFYSLQSILLLENYCRANGIYFKYSSWHGATNVLFELLKENTSDYQGYTSVDSNTWLDASRMTLFKECHLHIKNQVGDIFEIAPDEIHMGIHRHCHIADTFIERIKDDNPWY
jgi:hypothetical protein